MTDIALFNMVQQQIRPWNVSSPALIEAITQLDRRLFVPEEKQALCYSDTEIPLDAKTHMLLPGVAARLIQALDIQPQDNVLVLGAGSGYTAALCARLATTVVCQDRAQSALDRAEKNCAAAGVTNIGFQKAEVPDCTQDEIKYDGILFREALREVPETCLDRLTDARHCVAQIAHDYALEVMRYTRDGDSIQQESLLDVVVSPEAALGDSVQVKEDFVF